jgi:hypothetical protein
MIMQKSGRSCLGLALVLLLSSTIVGQAHVLENSTTKKIKNEMTPLHVQGQVVKVELTLEDAHSIVFNLRLRLELVNAGDRPVILLRHPIWLGALTLARSQEDARAYKYIYQSSAWPSVSGAPEWKALRQRLNQQNPPAELTQAVTPGNAFQYETDTVLYIEKRGNFDKTSQPWDAIRRASPVWLQVSLEMWPVNVEPRVDPNILEFGRMLQQRWRQFGQLQIERVTSEPIKLDFPK